MDSPDFCEEMTRKNYLDKRQVFLMMLKYRNAIIIQIQYGGLQ